MTWLWLICFSLLAAGPALGATVLGSVRLTDSIDPGVRKHKDYSGVVVWLEPAGEIAPHAMRPPARARMEQRGKRFMPHVLAVQAGAPVEFPNFDPIFHSAFSNFSGQVFDLGLYAPGTSRTVHFTRIGIVHVFCNIHPIMSAIVVVLRHPWFAVSDVAGSFSLPEVPPGDYSLHVYHERAAERVLQTLTRKLSVPASSMTLPPLEISETGYVQTLHKNKYGQDYPPVAGDDHGYGGRHQ